MKEQRRNTLLTWRSRICIIEDYLPDRGNHVVALFVPSSVPLIGMLMFGNLVKEIGTNTFRLFDAASNSISERSHDLPDYPSGQP